MNIETIASIREQLARSGIAVVDGPISREEYLGLARSVGTPIGKELIALRPGAHAYVAKPGRVPLHTDHPEVHIVSWWCEVQDPDDGATMLLDASAVVERMAEETKEALREVELWCPPLEGGPPTLRSGTCQRL